MVNDADHPTSEDTGKPVVDTAGNRIGIITAVEEDTVEIDPEPEIDLTENLRALLGGDTTEADTYTIRRDALDCDRYADVAVFRIDADPDVRDDYAMAAGFIMPSFTPNLMSRTFTG